MKILINQPWGIGDIIFCMTIARRWIKEGHSILWPVLPQFVSQLQRAYPDITFCDWRNVKADYNRRDEHDWNNYRVVPLRWNVEIMNVPYHRCMETKYTMFNLDFKGWKELAMWNRTEKEDELFAWANRKPYRVINRTFGSDGKMEVEIESRSSDIIMMPSNKYSLFDWAKVLENATEIHTVSTSILYLLEILDINCPIHLYPRPTDPHFKQVDYLFTKPYILH